METRSSGMMELTYDPDADAFMLQLESGSAEVRTMEWGDGVFIDVDPNGRVLGIEVLDASTRFDADTLASLRVPEVRLTLAEAAAESGLSPSTLRVQLNSGRLSGKKQGRDWTVTLADLWNYLESRAASGRPARSRKARRLRAAGNRVR